MEMQIMNMIKKSFPVESSSSGGEDGNNSENVVDEGEGHPDYELSFKRKLEGENAKINDSVKEERKKGEEAVGYKH